CRSTLQTGEPHAGPFTTSTQEQPVSTDAPLANTSNGRQVKPLGHAPLQVAKPPALQCPAGSVATHASTSVSRSDAVPVHDPFSSAFEIAVANFVSTLSTHSAKAAEPLSAGFPAHAALARAFAPAPFSLAAAQRASPEKAAPIVVVHVVAAASAASASPGHAALSSAFVKLARSFVSAFSRQFASTAVPASTALAPHFACAYTAIAVAFAFASAHASSG